MLNPLAAENLQSVLLLKPKKLSELNQRAFGLEFKPSKNLLTRQSLPD
jgi:hypothetical protein